VENEKHTVYIDEFLWEHLTAPAPKTRAALELVPGSGPSSPELAVRGGMHDAAALSRLLVSQKPFSGLVVCIGVNAASSDELLRSITNFIVGLIRDDDFTCRMAKDEFLMICPGDHGAEAHRRLTAISEHLWDYQLRVAGTAPILFTWGAVDVKRERLVDAISAATERMEQTRRTRESAFFSLNRRKAV
jgi:hypothetical protein